VLTLASQLGPRRQLSLAQELSIDRTVMTYLLDDLEAAGLVERRADPADRRGTLVRLTGRGIDVIDQALEAHLANEERLLRPLSAADRRSLDRLLRRLLSDLDS
jgi:DNA-binding MarR family transcriptional regulator